MSESRDPVTQSPAAHEPYGAPPDAALAAIAPFAAAVADRYVVERELGHGGMATVYLARDVRHDRLVALKVLRPELSAIIGGERFLREIRTTANLQHPHLLPLHDSGEAEGLVFYVMPFVDGESLRDRLTREKQLPVADAVRIAREVASALDYAHRHGVIHRDIKPENILLHDGQALVADFGIAFAAVRSEGGARMTETGMSLGTPQYMAPEQAMGEREITARADVYALGTVLYEMLVGEAPFTGPTPQAIVARMLTEEPRGLVVQRKSVPAHVEAAVHRALEKLPADRFTTAAEFAAALEDGAWGSQLGPRLAAANSSTYGNHGGRTPNAQRPALLIAGMALVTGIVAFLGGRLTAPEPERPLARFVVSLPDSVVAVGRCCGGTLALSPDGRTLVFAGVAMGDGGPLYRRSIGSLEAEPIPGTERASVPFFSPDGRWLGFFVDGRLSKVPLSGGPPVSIAASERAREASWGPDDQIIFGGIDGRIFTVPASGGAPRALTERDSLGELHAPFLLPGGRFALVTMRHSATGNEGARIGRLDLTSGRIDTIGLGMRAQYALGHLLFTTTENTLFAQPFDVREGKTTGDPVAIAEGVAVSRGLTHEFAVSPEGSLVFQPARTNLPGEQLVLDGPGGRNLIAMPPTQGQLELEDPAFSPDGRRIALRLIHQGPTDLWLFDRQQATLDRFTVGGASAPVWSRDGGRIAYSTDAGLVVRLADQTGAPEIVLRSKGLSAWYAGSWLPDGRSLVFHANRQSSTRWDIGVVTLGDSVPRWLVATEFEEIHPQVSPDGRLLAYVSTRSGRREVYVQPLAGDGPRVQVSAEGGDSPRWSPDGRTLYFADLSRRAIVAATLERGAELRVASRRKVIDRPNIDLNPHNVNWDVHPNGRDLLYVVDADGAEPRRLVWIQNWTELARRTGER